MPIIKMKSGYKYGQSGKVYRSKAKAVKQGQAIRLSQIRRGKRPK